jgi:cytochrome P450
MSAILLLPYFVLQGQYLVRRGQRIAVNLVALHRQPRHWGGEFGDPNCFNPARFMPGAAEASSRHPHAFKPFGFGVRACAGMQFAMWEAKTLIPMLYNQFTFKLVENIRLRPSRCGGNFKQTAGCQLHVMLL